MANYNPPSTLNFREVSGLLRDYPRPGDCAPCVMDHGLYGRSDSTSCFDMRLAVCLLSISSS